MTPEQREALTKALAALPGGEWEVWTSCSFRRITARVNGRSGQDGGVLSGVVQRDGHPDLSMSERQLMALCTLRNTIAEILCAEDSEVTP
jgi:hypothetical protein